MLYGKLNKTWKKKNEEQFLIVLFFFSKFWDHIFKVLPIVLLGVGVLLDKNSRICFNSNQVCIDLYHFFEKL